MTLNRDNTIPYVAQTVPVVPRTKYTMDLYNKADRAINEFKGATLMNALAPCPRGWRCDSATELELIKLAVETCYWPLYEVVNGEFKLSYKPKNKLPLEEWLKPQGRFKHLFSSEEGKALIAKAQEEVDRKWKRLLFLCGEEE